MYYLHTETRTIVSNQKELRKPGNNVYQLLVKIRARTEFAYTATDLSDNPNVLSFLVLPNANVPKRKLPITDENLFPYERYLIERYSGVIDGERIVVYDPNAVLMFRLEHA